MRACVSTVSNLKPATKRRLVHVLHPLSQVRCTLRHTACGVGALLKLRCNGCEIDHPNQLQHDYLLPDDILSDMHFDEAVEKVNSTAVIRDWLTFSRIHW